MAMVEGSTRPTLGLAGASGSCVGKGEAVSDKLTAHFCHQLLVRRVVQYRVVGIASRTRPCVLSLNCLEPHSGSGPREWL